MSQRMVFQCTYGKENPERATLPFVAANVAATAGMEATVVCTVEAVWLGTKGGADGVVSKGLTPLADLLAEFRGNGGKIWLCGACTKPRESPKLTRPRSHHRRGCRDHRGHRQRGHSNRLCLEASQRRAFSGYSVRAICSHLAVVSRQLLPAVLQTQDSS